MGVLDVVQSLVLTTADLTQHPTCFDSPESMCSTCADFFHAEGASVVDFWLSSIEND